MFLDVSQEIMFCGRIWGDYVLCFYVSEETMFWFLDVSEEIMFCVTALRRLCSVLGV